MESPVVPSVSYGLEFPPHCPKNRASPWCHGSKGFKLGMNEPCSAATSALGRMRSKLVLIMRISAVNRDGCENEPPSFLLLVEEFCA